LLSGSDTDSMNKSGVGERVEGLSEGLPYM
jgi:hypothetical protein